MKLKISQFVLMWNFIDKIYSMNDSFPPQFEGSMSNNFKVFAPLIKQIQGREAELKDKEIDVPLSQMTIDSLPRNLPAGTINAFKPLLIDHEEIEFTSTLDQLLDEQRTAEPTEKDSD